MKTSVSVQYLAGLSLVILGISVMTGWVLHSSVLVQICHDLTAMVFDSALCFALIGIALLLTALKVRRTAMIQTSIGWLVLGLSSLILLENLFDVNLLIDVSSLHSWLKDGNPSPGRMAPNTCLGFISSGLVLILMSRVHSRVRGIAVQGATIATLMFGLTGLIDYWLRLDLLYSWFQLARMAPHTAIGMVIASFGFWSSWRYAEWHQARYYFNEDEKIGFIGAAMLVAVALAAGLTGFAVQQFTLEKTLSDSLPLVLKNQTTLFHAMVRENLIDAENVATRSDLIRYTHLTTTQPQNADAAGQLQAIGQNILASGFTGVALYDAKNQELLRHGSFAHQPKIKVNLGLWLSAELLWDRDFYIKSRLPLFDDNKMIGSLVLERPLPIIYEQFAKAEGFGRTGEMGMCVRESDHLLCFPQRRNPAVYETPINSQIGKSTPMGLAVNGQSGLFSGVDYRGRNVIAAYGPLTDTGLGIVVKQDTEELYQPIRKQLHWTVPLLLLLVTIGAMLLRSRVTPLVSKLLSSERNATENELRIRTVVNNVGEGIITANRDGVIESFNNAASDIFGYTADEAIGISVKVLMPPEMRTLYDVAMDRYLKGGAPRIIGKKSVEFPGLHKNGTVFHMELAVNEIRIDGRHLLVGIVRDISERKQAEMALFGEKERLRITLSSIGDAVITTDTAGNVTYLNPVAEAMTGWGNAEATGLPLPTVFHTVDEVTGETAFNPVELVLQNGVAAGLATNTLLVQRGGASFAIEDSAAPIQDQDGRIIGVVLVFHDVSHARKMAAQMTYQASHDALTGLINRREFERRLEHALQTGKAEGKQHALMYLDLDQFKVVNDTSGHAAGDELLRQLSTALQAKLRQSDTLARLGGDEFGVLLESCTIEPAMRIAELLRQTVSDFHFVWQDKVFAIGVSIGLVPFSNGGVTLSDILRMSDAACYVAKDKGRNRVHVYTPEDKELTQRHGEMGWIGRIKKALDEERFVLYSQKILPLHEAAAGSDHYEVLLRMQDEDGTIVPPAAFIPAAERYGLMPLLDRWVIKTAFAHYAARYRAQGSGGICAINLSGTSICDEHFLAFVCEQFNIHKVPPDRICFEVTETSAIANLNEAANLMRELKALGCHFSLDDFGSGMSSFSYLKHLPVDYLKIDGSFVKDMVEDPIDHAMVEAINHIGQVMGIQTIAEFVENDQILEKLKKIGVDFAQGYGIGKPVLLWKSESATALLK